MGSHCKDSSCGGGWKPQGGVATSFRDDGLQVRFYQAVTKRKEISSGSWYDNDEA